MKVFLTLFLTCNALIVMGQTPFSIEGAVFNSLDRKPLRAATVVLNDHTDSFPVKASTTDEHGKFSFRGLVKHDYILKISSVGYQTWLQKCAPDSLPTGMSLTIYLTPLQKDLSEVTVTARAPLIKQEIDRLSYDVQADKDSKVQHVLEFMAKVPLLSIDGEENVKLKGSSNYRIFVNGRPSTLFAANPKEALRAMPASSVKKIEVITTPPARYDAEGLAGIINIVMNKRLIDGYNASIGLSYNNTVGTGQNLTLNGKKGKLGITGRAYLFQDFRRPVNHETRRQNKYPFRSDLYQAVDYSFTGSYFSESIELSYDLDSLNLFTAAINFTNTRYDDRTMLASSVTNEQQKPQQSYRSLTLNPQRESGLSVDINYQKGFRRKKDRLLTLSYQYQHAPGKQENQVFFTERNNYPLNDYWQKNTSRSGEQTFQADYVHPAGKINFEGGVKAIFRKNSSDYTGGSDGSTGVAYPQPDDSFTYRQQVFSVYQSWQLQMKLLELKAGLRLEHTVVDADFASQPENLQTSYNNLIPVVSLQKRFSHSTLNLGYTQRITRPGLNELNPFVSRSNPAFAVTGNSRLEAVLKNNLELTYSRYGKSNLNISTSYSFSNNTIQQVTTLRDSIAYTTYENLGKERSLALNISFSLPITPVLAANMNAQLNYVWLEGISNTYLFTNEGLQGYAYANLNYDFKKNWRASIYTTFLGRDIYLQGSSNGYVNSSLRISRNLLQKKITIAAAISNPYSKYRYIQTKTNGIDFTQERIRQRYYRSFSISFNYNFGSLKNPIRKNQRSIENDDVTGKKK